jgi:hypothetical protein
MPRNHQQPETDQTDQKCAETTGRDQQRLGTDPTAGRHGGERRNEQNADEIFEDENAEHQIDEASLHALLGEGLHDDGRRRDSDDRTRVDALEQRPAEQLRGAEAEQCHGTAVDEGHESRRGANLGEPSQTEFEPEPEHEQNDAQLGQRTHHLRIHVERDGQVRSDDHARQQIAKHHWLANALKDEGRDRRHAQDEGEVGKKRVRVGHGPSGSPSKTKARSSARRPGQDQSPTAANLRASGIRPWPDDSAGARN